MPKGIRVRTYNDEPSKTRQSDRHEAEITHILNKYGQTGIIDHLRNVDMQFADISEFSDYADAMMQLREAERVFYGLPPKIRRLFNSDVATWLDTAHDPEKLEALRPELEKLGILQPDQRHHVELDKAPLERPASASPQDSGSAPE